MQLEKPALFPPILFVITLLFAALVVVLYVEDQQGDTSCGGG